MSLRDDALQMHKENQGKLEITLISKLLIKKIKFSLFTRRSRTV